MLLAVKVCALEIGISTTLQWRIQNKTNSENGHLVFSIFKKKQENSGVGDISSLFQRHCQTNEHEISPTPLFSCLFLEYREYKMSIFGICFILYFLKLSACRGYKGEVRSTQIVFVESESTASGRVCTK